MINTDLFKKSALVKMNIARDFYMMKPGERVMPISEYTDKFSVSRGILQNALAMLQEDGCIALEKRGVKGTFLSKIDYPRLYTHTNWGSITGTMPIPLCDELMGLATALSDELERAAFPFSFAYVTGSEKRLQALENMMYDFIIVTRATALKYMEDNDFIEECVTLYECTYSKDFVLYFFDKTKHKIEDGMRIAVDMKCRDQWELTERLCQGKNVTYVPFPYISFEDLVRKNAADCLVYRSLDKTKNDSEKDIYYRKLHAETIEIPEINREDMRIPVILVNKSNYGMSELLKRYIHPAEAGQIQKEVLSGERAFKLY